MDCGQRARATDSRKLRADHGNNSKTASRNHGVHVLRLGDALHVKRVQQGPAGEIRLISVNESYPPIDVVLTDIEVIGRVVWKGGRL